MGVEAHKLPVFLSFFLGVHLNTPKKLHYILKITLLS